MYNPNYRDRRPIKRVHKRKPRLIFIPLEEHISGDLRDILDEKFENPEYCILHTGELEPHHYYQIGKLAARIARKNQYRNYYLLTEGNCALIAIIIAKLIIAIGRIKIIELLSDNTIRSLDVP